jgi:hypothetical protein
MKDVHREYCTAGANADAVAAEAINARAIFMIMVIIIFVGYITTTTAAHTKFQKARL